MLILTHEREESVNSHAVVITFVQMKEKKYQKNEWMNQAEESALLRRLEFCNQMLHDEPGLKARIPNLILLGWQLSKLIMKSIPFDRFWWIYFCDSNFLIVTKIIQKSSEGVKLSKNLN